jgi:hypothetical protein
VKHDKGCADSPNPPEDCECKCKRRYHGTGIYDIPDVLPESPYGAAAPPRRRKGRRALVITLALSVSAGTAIGLAASGTFGASSSGSSDLSVKVNVDLNKTISELSSLGYGERQVATSGTTTRRTECPGSSTRQVRKFLIRNHCEQYQAQTWVITRRGATARVALSWVEMRTASLARKYKGVVDTYGSGNPPGVSSAFDGRCYASAQRGSTIQTVEVQATGKVDADRDIL